MKYEVVMGLEVHVELDTESKLFCSCSAKFGAEPNENVCPACAGMPGMIPILNRKAVELGIAAGLVTNCQISPTITFDKKNYFYPDLSCGYQITQWFAPICRNGYVEIETNGGAGKRINLKQIHIEEDAGKLVHERGVTLVDYNRASVPLVEIVSKPDFRTADEVIAYVEKLRSLLAFAGVSDCRLQEGSMRCDVNLSVREAGTDRLGVRTEMKNLNSLRSISRAIEFESQRHISALEEGRSAELVQETRRWDDNLGESFSMRTKEDAMDYRYFPCSDIMPVSISTDWIDQVKSALPESAHDKYVRMTGELGASQQDSRLITGSKRLSDIFDGVMAHGLNARDVASWIVTELLSMTTDENKSYDDISIDCNKFALLISMVDSKTINRATAKKILTLIYNEDIDPVAYVKDNDLGMVTDNSFLEGVISSVLEENSKSVGQFLAGNEKVLGFLMGKAMSKTAGKADPVVVREMLSDALDKLRK
ncbi:MAG: Asp-tRNA(Asn)/Glu-tRNA(Gln) amidotransferase subunit GatB [Oscillospiraceae bacterium]|nr:Asp-tRNA(Asn)/Glu-tRNA(Gln) amidotransferase subunit GatB [Oscillospiraceae bacterium]